ncbi:MAG TPA: ATP-binding protein, partial [Pirellulales bacterium]
MKLLNVHVDGFGIWSDITLADLSPHCTVFYGPNEAGKTTLLEFIRAVLYGFSPQRIARYLPPVHAAIGGGS